MDDSPLWLECTICSEIMVEPRTLQCGHTFCRRCLQKLIDQAGNLKCPLDNRMFIVPGRDAGNLMRNFQLEDAIESGRKGIKITVKFPCSQHQDKEAKLICVSCNTTCCLDCVVTHADHGILRSVNCTVKAEQQKQHPNQLLQRMEAARPAEAKYESKDLESWDEIELKVFKVDGFNLNQPSDDIRRFHLKWTPNCYNYLRQKLSNEYGTTSAPEVFWKDSDGDFVKITSDDGLQVAARRCPAPFKVYVRFSSQPSSSGSASRPTPTTAAQLPSKQSELKTAKNKSNLSVEEFLAVLAEGMGIASSGSNSSSEAASNGPVHFGVTCDGCKGRVCGIRYKCQVCPNFDFCQSCMATVAHPHPMQPYTGLQSVQSLPNGIACGPVHVGVTCDGCMGSVRGVRYKCSVCDNFDLCESCQLQNKHPFHPMVSIRKQ